MNANEFAPRPTPSYSARINNGHRTFILERRMSFTGRTFTRINGLWDSCVTYLRWQKKSRLPRPPIIYAQIRYSSITSLLLSVYSMFPRFYRSVPFSFSSFPSYIPSSLFFLSYNSFLPRFSSLCVRSPSLSFVLFLLPLFYLLPSPSLHAEKRRGTTACVHLERVSAYSTSYPWRSEVGYPV